MERRNRAELPSDVPDGEWNALPLAVTEAGRARIEFYPVLESTTVSKSTNSSIMQGMENGKLAGALASAGVALRHAARPGDIGELICLHGVLYAREHG
jgi:hypothetical protein